MNTELLKDLYKSMLRIRLTEERIAQLYPEKEMRCPVHLCIGQEAVAAGVCSNLTSNDYVFSTHRSHGPYIAKGGDLKTMMAEIYGKATGCSQGKGGSMHLVDLAKGYMGSTPIVGSTIPIAVGTSFGRCLKGEKNHVTIAFFGEGATEEGVFHEAVNFASLKKLPMVFICENNLFSVYSPMEVRQPAHREVFELAKGHGVKSVQGDGNNVEEVYRLSGEAIRSARNGEGPAFLEFKTYRWLEHCGPFYDNNIGYRTEAEFLEWKKKCPIEFTKRRLLEGGVNQTDLDSLSSAIKKDIEAAVQFAKDSPFPDTSRLQEHIYA
jgi:TPP-dependent pyruvate/acetoin dehydrogenase alpha subunit